MSFKDLYIPKPFKEEKEYCGVILADLDKYNPEIKVCNGYDFYSSISYKKLIEKNKHLSFYKTIKDKYPFFNDQQVGVLIRWLYRGLTLDLAVRKIKNEYNTAMHHISKRS